MNATTVKCSLTNHMTTTHHMRHIFMLSKKLLKKFSSCNNLLNATIQSHPIKMGCCNANEKWLIVTTISHSCPVHHGTKLQVLIHIL